MTGGAVGAYTTAPMANGQAASAKIPAQLQAHGGRPFLFLVHREWALDSGNVHLLPEIDLAIERWERPAEEWELERAEDFHWGPVRFSRAVLELLACAGPSSWPHVAGTRINPHAILRLWRGSGWWPALVRFFGELQVDAARLLNSDEIELRPTSETLARNNAQHFRYYDPFP